MQTQKQTLAGLLELAGVAKPSQEVLHEYGLCMYALGILVAKTGAMCYISSGQVEIRIDSKRGFFWKHKSARLIDALILAYETEHGEKATSRR